MAESVAAQVRRIRGPARLSFRFRDKAYQHLRSTLLGKTLLFTDRTDWSDEQNRSCLPRPNTTSRLTFDV